MSSASRANSRGLVLVGWFALAAVGCDPFPDSPGAPELPGEVGPRAYVGVVEDTDIVIGAVVEADRLRIYTCGGATSMDASRWFKGSAGDDFTIEKDDWTITGAWVDGRIVGELLSPAGDVHPWSADLAAPGTDSGLYAASTGSCTSGVVIRQDAPGGATRAQGTWCDGQGNLAQIIVLAPVAATPQGILVEVEPPRGRDVARFYVTPATP
jgi:hypothetical protein